MVRFFICLLSFLSLVSATSGAISVQGIDTSAISLVRQFDTAALNKYRADKDFNYTTTVENVEEGSSLSYLINSFLGKFFRSSLGGVNVSDVLIFALIFFAAVMLVIQVFRINSAKMFSKNSESILNFTVESESIHHTDFDQLIQEAMSSGNYRLAVRLHYLKTLKVLSEAGLIKWQKGKTNFEYYYELKSEIIRKEFHALTVVFESAWYGHHEISPEIFAGNASSFNHFLTLIRKQR